MDRSDQVYSASLCIEDTYFLHCRVYVVVNHPAVKSSYASLTSLKIQDPILRTNDSFTIALLKIMNYITSFSEQGKLAGAIFIETSKALDLVYHHIIKSR